MAAFTADGKSKTGMSAKELREFADYLFGKKASLHSLQQEIAENFHPLRADFTIKRYASDDFAHYLMTSYPLLCARDLSDQIGTMLRNANKPWFAMVSSDMKREGHEEKAWLQWASGLQRRAMYAPATQLKKATKVGDLDYSVFGCTVITVRLNNNRDDLLYRCWHLRDCAWMEDENGQICAIFRRWKPSIRTLVRMFDGRPGCSVDQRIQAAVKKEPDKEVECYHMMVAADMYDGDSRDMPWRSVYFDCDNTHEMQSVAQRRREYVIPRWAAVPALSQYAHSPATIVALPEARLLQSMTYTLLEAGEKVVNPPIVATEQAVKSNIELFSGGITYVDRDYDERGGAALRPLLQDAKGIPFSMEMQRDSRALLAQCFYLNKLSLPIQVGDMTATEVSQRVQEYIRGALPLFEPIEDEYNGGLCEESFGCLFDASAFGSPFDIPKGLRGQDIRFRFSSPLHDAIEQEKGQKFLQMKEMVAAAIAIDRNVVAIPDAPVALRDALEGIGIPTKWTRSDVMVKQMMANEAAQQQAQQVLANMQTGAGVAKDLATARSMDPATAQ